MADSRIVDQLLNEVASTWYTDYNYMGTGTSGAANTDSLTDLITPVQIGAAAANRNKLSESGTTEAFINNNTWVRLFKLNTLEPNSLPVNLFEFGLFKTEDDNNDMGSRHILSVAQTKDNTSSWTIRFSGFVNRIN